MKKNILLLFFILIINYSSNGQWTSQTLSGTRTDMAAASGGDKAIFAGGIGFISIPPPAFDMYNYNLNTWTNGSISRGRSRLAGASCGTKLLFAGGANDDILSVEDNVDIYNGLTSSWTTATISRPRCKLAGAGAGSKVLFAGGAFDNGSLPPVSYDAVDIYDTLTQAWTTSALSVARHSLAGAAAGNKIIFAGGVNTNGIYFKTVDIYDVTTGTWTLDSLSQARSNCVAASAGNKIYIAGGLTVGNLTSKVVDIYDVVTQTWTVDSLLLERADLGAASVGNFVIFAGGRKQSTVYNNVDIFDTATLTWTTSALTTARSNAPATSIGNMFIIGGGADANLFPIGDAEIFTVLPNSIENVINQSTFNIFPNPVSEYANIKFLNSITDGQLEISDAVGKIVYQQKLDVTSKVVSIPTFDYSKGIYFVKVTEGGKSMTGKFLIN